MNTDYDYTSSPFNKLGLTGKTAGGLDYRVIKEGSEEQPLVALVNGTTSNGHKHDDWQLGFRPDGSINVPPSFDALFALAGMTRDELKLVAPETAEA